MHNARCLSKKISTRDRFKFNSSFPDANGCINWLAAKDKDGYGRIQKSDGVRVRAHRFAYEEFIGPIPEGYCVCHHCDNPSCVNPEHLWVGTNKENTLDRAKKGRGAKNNLAGIPKKLCPNKKLSISDVHKIRELLNSGMTQKSIAKLYNLHWSSIQKIKLKTTWSHI